MGKPIPLTPSTQIKGSQFEFPYDDIEVEITAVKALTKDYTKKDGTVVAANVPLGEIEFKPTNGTSPAASYQYTAGDAARVKPNADGTGFESAVEGKEFEGLTDNCRLGFFFGKLVAAGFPESKFGSTMEFLVGTRGHIRQVDPPKNNNKGDDKKVPVFTKITSEGGGSSSSGGADATKVKETATKLVRQIVAKKGVEVKKVELGQIANKALDGKVPKPFAMEVVKLVLDDKFLKSEDGWKATATGVAPAEAAGEDITL